MADAGRSGMPRPAAATLSSAALPGVTLLFQHVPWLPKAGLQSEDNSGFKPGNYFNDPFQAGELVRPLSILPFILALGKSGTPDCVSALGWKAGTVVMRRVTSCQGQRPWPCPWTLTTAAAIAAAAVATATASSTSPPAGAGPCPAGRRAGPTSSMERLV